MNLDELRRAYITVGNNTPKTETAKRQKIGAMQASLDNLNPAAPDVEVLVNAEKMLDEFK